MLTPGKNRMLHKTSRFTKEIELLYLQNTGTQIYCKLMNTTLMSYKLYFGYFIFYLNLINYKNTSHTLHINGGTSQEDKKVGHWFI